MEAGHEFLLRMGKTRLRPGGIEATNWLLNSVEITPETQILEVACNIGTTTVELVKRFHCHVTAIDLNVDVLPKTKENIARNKETLQTSPTPIRALMLLSMKPCSLCSLTSRKRQP